MSIETKNSRRKTTKQTAFHFCSGQDKSIILQAFFRAWLWPSPSLVELETAEGFLSKSLWFSNISNDAFLTLFGETPCRINVLTLGWGKHPWGKTNHEVFPLFRSVTDPSSSVHLFVCPSLDLLAATLKRQKNCISWHKIATDCDCFQQRTQQTHTRMQMWIPEVRVVGHSPILHQDFRKKIVFQTGLLGLRFGVVSEFAGPQSHRSRWCGFSFFTCRQIAWAKEAGERNTILMNTLKFWKEKFCPSYMNISLHEGAKRACAHVHRFTAYPRTSRENQVSSAPFVREFSELYSRIGKQ